MKIPAIIRGTKDKERKTGSFRTFLQRKGAGKKRSASNCIDALPVRLNCRRHLGKVTLVGAGPGDPDLLTIKGKKKLEEADVIVYDRLINESILNINPYAEKIFVGKVNGKHSMEQKVINQLLLRLSENGKNIVRLKGGDPFIFGRGGEEIEFLRTNCIPCEVIPGITAAQAAACCCVVPLTMRGISSSVAFCTGHPVESIQVPDVDTLVYYMAASTMRIVAAKIVKKGWKKTTPVTIIINATLPTQSIELTTLEEILLTGKNYPPPLIMLIKKL